MARLLAFGLLLAAAGYTLIMLWMAWFTLPFLGFDAGYADLRTTFVLIAMALSPVPVWMDCLRRANALRRGERPRI